MTAPQCCPLCHQPLGDLRHRSHQGKTLPEVIGELMHEVEAWADGDALANDGIELDIADLITHVAAEMAEPLMGLYKRRLRQCQMNSIEIERRVAEERQSIAAILEGFTPAKSPRGAPRKSRCKRGHLRTPENVTARGECRDCDRDRHRVHAFVLREN